MKQWSELQHLIGFREFKWYQLTMLSILNVHSSVYLIKKVFHEDRYITIHDLTNEVGISLGSCQSILTQHMNLREVSAKFATHVLTDGQKHHCVWAFRKNFRGTNNSFWRSTQVTNMDLWVQPWNKEIVISVKELIYLCTWRRPNKVTPVSQTG
jgi:hypothetical protein